MITDQKLGRVNGESARLITYVTDLAGHDLRYATESSKLQREPGWAPCLQFEEGFEKTVNWCLKNAAWLGQVTSENYQTYHEDQYKNIS